MLKTGLLTRRRIISVLEEFEQARATPETKPFIRNPLECKYELPPESDQKNFYNFYTIQGPLLDPYIKFENKLDVTQKVAQLELEEVIFLFFE